MMNNFSELLIGNTKIWGRTEKNLIFLLSELIDNSMASYDNQIKKDFEQEYRDIILTFDTANNYISIEDFAEGFDISHGLGSIGRDEEQSAETNQHFVGLKECLNFFTNFSIIISERIINNEYIRTLNVWIYKKGKLIEDILLKPTNITGSKIIMFSNYNAFKDFIKDNSVLTDDQKILLLNLNLDEKIKSTNSLVSDILLSRESSTDLIRISLAGRYAYTPSVIPGFRIRFKIFDHKHHLVEDSLKAKIEYFDQIAKNNWENLYSFNSKKFLDSNNIWKKNLSFQNQQRELFLLELEKLFLLELEKLFLLELERHKNKINDKYSNEHVNLNTNTIVSKKKYNYEYLFKEKKWDNFPLAKIIFQEFFNNFINGSEESFFVDINFKNLREILEKDLVFGFKTSDTSNSVIDISYKLGIFSEKYKLVDEKNYTKPIWNFTSSYNNKSAIAGFDVILNKRAIYNGPNINKRNSVSSIVLQDNPPNKLLASYLINKPQDEFPNYIKTGPTSIKMGGSPLDPTSSLFGRIVLQEGKMFKAGLNKALISNVLTLENFTKKFLAVAGINVLTRFIHSLNNQKHNDISDSTIIGSIINKIELSMIENNKNYISIEEKIQNMSNKERKK